MCEPQQNTGTAAGENPNANGQNESPASSWRSEGCIKELKLEGNEVTLKIDPTEAFVFGVDEVKKILFVMGEKPSWESTNPVDAKLVEAGTEFVVDKVILANGKEDKSAKFSIGLLYALKKDCARIRMVVDELDEKAKPRIQSIVLI